VQLALVKDPPSSGPPLQSLLITSDNLVMASLQGSRGTLLGVIAGISSCHRWKSIAIKKSHY
jgi:hypothetical protein